MSTSFMKLVDGKVDFSGWNFDDNETLNVVIREAAEDVIRDAFDEQEPYLILGYSNETSDPLELRLSLPLASDDNDPWYSISLSDLTAELVENYRPGGEISGYAIGDENKKRLMVFVTALRQLADSVETRINSGTERPFRMT